jgi:hypothetical protein
LSESRINCIGIGIVLKIARKIKTSVKKEQEKIKTSVKKEQGKT